MKKLVARLFLFLLLPICVWNAYDRTQWARKFKSGVI